MNRVSRCFSTLAAMLAFTVIAGCAHRPPSDPYDPLETVNRFTYGVNQKADKYVLRPVAKGYNKITPNRVQESVGNFFANLNEPVVMANSLLQLKWGSFNQSLGRFMLNSSAGVGGLFDVASALDVPNPDEDFGQTMGYWGLGPGPYLVLPFLGPSDARDLTGSLVDQFAYPLSYATDINKIRYDYFYLPYLLRVLEGVNLRASLLGFDSTLEQQFDPYAFIRGYYLENRQEKVYDGHVPADQSSPDGLPTSGADSDDSSNLQDEGGAADLR